MDKTTKIFTGLGCPILYIRSRKWNTLYVSFILARSTLDTPQSCQRMHFEEPKASIFCDQASKQSPGFSPSYAARSLDRTSGVPDANEKNCKNSQAEQGALRYIPQGQKVVGGGFCEGSDAISEGVKVCDPERSCSSAPETKTSVQSCGVVKPEVPRNPEVLVWGRSGAIWSLFHLKVS